MTSPTTFAYDFKHRGVSNIRRDRGYVPVLNVGRFRTPKTIVSRLARFYELKRQYHKSRKENRRRNRQFLKRTS
jgi:succinate dehydrogenase/fumarate reductase flavoprotein subunit